MNCKHNPIAVTGTPILLYCPDCGWYSNSIVMGHVSRGMDDKNNILSAIREDIVKKHAAMSLCYIMPNVKSWA